MCHYLKAWFIRNKLKFSYTKVFVVILFFVKYISKPPPHHSRVKSRQQIHSVLKWPVLRSCNNLSLCWFLRFVSDLRKLFHRYCKKIAINSYILWALLWKCFMWWNFTFNIIAPYIIRPLCVSGLTVTASLVFASSNEDLKSAGPMPLLRHRKRAEGLLRVFN